MAGREKKKRSSLDIRDKMKIFGYVDANPNMKQVQVAGHFGIAPTTLNTILKNRKKTEEEAGQGSLKRKRVRTAKFEDLEDILAEWFHQHRSQHISLDGVVIKAKAREIAGRIGYEDFTASNGWITRFQRRHEIRYKKISGESEAVDIVTVQSWKLDILPGIVREYQPKDRFNCAELGLFYSLYPDRSMVHRTETCHGGKRSKERVTVLLACNQDGSEKLKPYMIGKSRKPHCFKNVRHFPCDYSHNKKAWMTAEKFKNWLRGLDAKMRISRRQIHLLTDNCPAHPKDLDFLTNIKVEFLPANTTSHTQPLDMGIIKVLKHRYRQKLVRRLIVQMTRDEPLTPKDFKINIFQAMHYIVASWNEVTKETIQNCFRKAGLLPPGEAPLLEADLAAEAEIEGDAGIDMVAALDAPPGAYSEVTERWEDVLQVFEETGMSFEDYVSADDFTPVCEVQDIQDIIDTLRKETEENEEDVDGEWESGSDGEGEGEDGQPARPISKAEAMGSLERFRQYLSQLNAPADEVEDLVTLTSKLENTTLGLASRNLKQGTIDMFFKKH